MSAFDHDPCHPAAELLEGLGGVEVPVAGYTMSSMHLYYALAYGSVEREKVSHDRTSGAGSK